MDKFVVIFLAVFGALALACVAAVLGAFPFMWAWNYVMPSVFNLPTLHFWQAFCLLWVSSAMFKSALTTTHKD